MKKILILGSKGALGNELVWTFSHDNKYEVAGLDKDELDITDEQKLSKYVQAFQPNIIINAAAFNDVDDAETATGFETAKKLNGEVPGMLARIAKEADAIFAQYVSDYIFDGKKGKYTEQDEPNPISNYGISKAIGEKSVQRVGGKYYLIRTSKLFGQKSESPEAKKSFFETMLALSEDRDDLKIVDDEKSCFTYVPDLAEVTKNLIEKKYEYGIYHIVNEGAVTWFEGAKKLFELTGNKNIELIPVGQDEFPRPAKRAHSTVLLNTKLPPLRHYEQALEEWLKRAR